MKKGKKSTIFLTVAFFAGLSLLLYPTVSDYWNSHHQTHAIDSYEKEVGTLDNSEYEKMLSDAREYNETLVGVGDASRFLMSEEEKAKYETLLNPSGDGMMAYVEIPSISCYLPIYHGTDEGVLQIAIGHIEGSSLPVGGIGTHTVLSGHRGLPSAKLFTNIDKLEEGDIFYLHVLDETLAYQVDQIRIVLPEETDDLSIDPMQDHCTLVTCTPYGINTHRLLVRGTRIENPEGIGDGHVQANAVQIEPVLVAPFLAIPMLLLLLILLLVKDRRKKEYYHESNRIEKEMDL